MLAADGCASSSGNPACCFCGVWAPAGRGSGGRHVRTHWFGHAYGCRIAGVDCTDTYASTGILIHGAAGSTYLSGISARRCYGFLDDPGPADYALSRCR
jgi:hypothetical protein